MPANRKYMSGRLNQRQPALVLVFFLIFSAIANAQDEGRTIEYVDVHGNRRLSDEEILKYVETRAGQRLDSKRLKSDLQRLLDLAQFNVTKTKVTLDEGRLGGVAVIFEVLELPLIVEVTFEGLKYVTADALRAELKVRKLDVLPNTPYDMLRMRASRRAILEYLARRGFENAKVNVWEEEKSASTVAIAFVIDEMPGDDDQIEKNAS